VALSLFSAAMPGSSNVVWSLVLFCGGAVVFAAAMAFDISDRERLTRRADCAFWLHLLAAPLIVHSLITLATGGITVMYGPGVLTIVLVIGLLAVVAVAIDRRALLVSGLSYLGFAIGIVVSGVFGGGSAEFAAWAATLVILGAFVLALGVGWMPLRRRVMSLLSPVVANRLPPVPASP
jgi:MFS family permease